MKVCDKTCIFFFFPIINKYFLMAKRSLLSRCPSYFHVLSRFQLSFWKYRTLRLHLLTEFSCRKYGTDRIPGLIPHGQCSVNHHLYPQLGDKLSHFIWVIKDFIFQST